MQAWQTIYTNGNKLGNIVDAIFYCIILEERYMLVSSSCEHSLRTRVEFHRSDTVLIQISARGGLPYIAIRIYLIYLVNNSLVLPWCTTGCTRSLPPIYWRYIKGATVVQCMFIADRWNYRRAAHRGACLDRGAQARAVAIEERRRMEFPFTH